MLALAKSGKAHVAVVYRSDARGAAPLTVLDEPRDAPIASVVVGIAASSEHASAAQRLLDYLVSADGQAVLARHGFSPPRD